MESLIASGKRNLSLDLSKLDYLYSDAINALVVMNKRIRRFGRLSLLAPQPPVMEILHKSGVQNIVRIFADEAEIAQLSAEMGGAAPAPAAAPSAPAPVPAAKAAPISEFDDFRAEIGSAFGDGFTGAASPAPAAQQQTPAAASTPPGTAARAPQRPPITPVTPPRLTPARQPVTGSQPVVPPMPQPRPAAASQKLPLPPPPRPGAAVPPKPAQVVPPKPVAQPYTPARAEAHFTKKAETETRRLPVIAETRRMPVVEETPPRSRRHRRRLRPSSLPRSSRRPKKRHRRLRSHAGKETGRRQGGTCALCRNRGRGEPQEVAPGADPSCRHSSRHHRRRRLLHLQHPCRAESGTRGCSGKAG